MEETIRKRSNKKRKNRIRRRQIRTTIFFISCIIFVLVSIKIIGRSRPVNNIKNNDGISSVDKVDENQVTVGGYKGSDNQDKSSNNSVKGEENSVKSEISTVPQVNTDSETNTDDSIKDVSQEKIEDKNQSVNAEQALISDGKKTAFLTFDDGPSVTVTPKILDILKQYKINATFFVVGANIEQDEESKNILKRTLEAGNSIGNHSYSHNLGKLYPNNKVNVDYFMQEVDKTNDIMKSVLGQAFTTRILRMPGGYISRQYYRDPNLSAFDVKIKEKNMYSIDWNAYDADSEGKWKNAEQILSEVKSTVGDKEKVIILMHDTYGKEETAKALPQIIEYLKGQGYEFKTLK